MLSEQALLYGNQSSAIRTLFEYGRKRAALVGRDKICDFSLGNPSVPPPQALFDAFESVLKADPMDTHGYTSAVGCDELRAALAESMTRRFGMSLKPENFFITAGAAAAGEHQADGGAVDQSADETAGQHVLHHRLGRHRDHHQKEGTAHRAQDQYERQYDGAGRSHRRNRGPPRFHLNQHSSFAYKSTSCHYPYFTYMAAGSNTAVTRLKPGRICGMMKPE